VSAATEHIRADDIDTRYDVVAVGASAGGLHAVRTVLGGIPATFPLPIVVVQHMDPHRRSLMAEILDRNCSLPVKDASEGERPRGGTVYVALPGHHLLVSNDRLLSFTRTEPVRFSRPSVDRLFESVARVYRDRAIAVVLTGTGRDGAAGVTAIGRAGGAVIAEDPSTAEFPGMPKEAIATGHVDAVMRLDEIAGALVGLVARRERT
jgi:two-component system chemotaxis response regulator CheB